LANIANCLVAGTGAQILATLNGQAPLIERLDERD
jgi:hypothetical protein